MTSRPKRASLKNQGAEILFPGGEAPTRADDVSGSMNASRQASLQASKQNAPSAETSDVDLLVFDGVLERISGQPRVTASFRFTEAELDALDDVVYRSPQRPKVRLAKQEVVRLGLAALLAEYEERGDESILGRYIARLHGS